MKRGLFLILVLLVACAQQQVTVYEPEPYIEPPHYTEPVQNPQVKHVVPQITMPEPVDERIELVKQFISNQNSENIYEYVAGLRKNMEISDGELFKILEKQEEIYAERANNTALFFELYEKAKTTFDDERLAMADKEFEDTFKPRLDFGVIYDKPEFEYSGEKNGDVFIKVKATEYNNIPGLYDVKPVEDTYVVRKVNGQWKIVDVVSNGEGLSYADLWETWHAMENGNQRERRSMNSLRTTIGLLTI